MFKSCHNCTTFVQMRRVFLNLVKYDGCFMFSFSCISLNKLNMEYQSHPSTKKRRILTNNMYRHYHKKDYIILYLCCTAILIYIISYNQAHDQACAGKSVGFIAQVKVSFPRELFVLFFLNGTSF